VSYACPWAHRTLIYRAVLGLEDMIPLKVVEPLMLEHGWIQTDGKPLYEIYRAAIPEYTGRVTVPVLWDEHEQRIVNNESSEIIRMLDPKNVFRPMALAQEIDNLNAFIYPEVNNGVYRAGFATTQDAYEAAVEILFAALDRIESRLASRRYLTGASITEADWRLFTTLLRFDPVYVGHFKCNRRRIADYPNLSGYVRDLYQQPGVATTVRMDHIKTHYYASHRTINPTAIVPVGPELDHSRPHDRAELCASV
jgi:putative glutathione S-transferase